jgi:hypothetical protein
MKHTKLTQKFENNSSGFALAKIIKIFNLL